MLWEQGVEGSNPFAPTLKIKELQGFVTPFFWPFQKSGHKKDTLFFKNIPIFFQHFGVNPLPKRTRLLFISSLLS